MKLAIFTIADYVSSQAGKLTIIGTFNRFNYSELPFSSPPFGVAIQCYLEPNDYGKKHKIKLHGRTENKKNTIFSVEVEMDVVPNPSNIVNTMAVPCMFPSLQFKHAGTYIIECKIGRKILGTIKFEVSPKNEKKEPPKDSPKPSGKRKVKRKKAIKKAKKLDLQS